MLRNSHELTCFAKRECVRLPESAREGYGEGLEQDIDPGQLAGMEVLRRAISRRHAFLRSFLVEPLPTSGVPGVEVDREPTPGGPPQGPSRAGDQDSGKDAFQRRFKNVLGRKFFSVKFKGACWNPKHSSVRNVDLAC